MEDLTRRKFVGAIGAGASMMSAASAQVAGERATPKQVRIGVVGGNFGSQFQWHLHPHSKVTAVCDLRDDRLQRLSEVYRCPNKYKNFTEFLKHRELDAVAIFTPLPLHVWMDIEAMKAGKHVINSVPAGLSIEELERLLDCVKRTGMKYMMAETSYYRPEIITCRKLSSEGAFGTIFHSESEYHHEGLLSIMVDERGFPNWRHGLPPMHYPTHCVGMVVPVTGERLVEVQAIGWGDKHEILQTNVYGNPFWSTNAFFKTSGGHSARISVCWHIAAGAPSAAVSTEIENHSLWLARKDRQIPSLALAPRKRRFSIQTGTRKVRSNLKLISSPITGNNCRKHFVSPVAMGAPIRSLQTSSSVRSSKIARQPLTFGRRLRTPHRELSRINPLFAAGSPCGLRIMERLRHKPGPVQNLFRVMDF